MRRLLRDLVSPLSRTNTGIPIWCSSHCPSQDVAPKYRFASEPQTNTWNWVNFSKCVSHKLTVSAENFQNVMCT
jgi:uncharacterized protein YdiU (UPF0061 family)